MDARIKNPATAVDYDPKVVTAKFDFEIEKEFNDAANYLEGRYAQWEESFVKKIRFMSVVSDVIEKIAYLHDENILLVKLVDAKVYAYKRVPAGRFADFVSADSLGKFWNEHFVKNPTVYPFTRVRSLERYV